VVLRERLEGPHVTAPAALAQLLPADHRLIGAGGELYRTSWEAAFDAQAGRYPSAVALAVLAGEQLAAGNPAGPLTPLYLRRPDATPPGAPKPVSTSDAAGPVDSPAGVR
jgi:tRNA A37 threonylcarbamoyladenosine modification protein TsaB